MTLYESKLRKLYLNYFVNFEECLDYLRLMYKTSFYLISACKLGIYAIVNIGK